MTIKRTSALCALAAASALTACGGGVALDLSSLPPAPAPDRPSVEVQRSSWNQPAAHIAEFLEVHASGGPWPGAGGDYYHPPGLVRFASAPTVRLTAGITERERAIALHGIALVNRTLPYHQHLRIGPDAPSVVAHYGGDLVGKVPPGEVFVEFHRTPSGRTAVAVAHQDTVQVYDETQERWEKKELRVSQVEMNGWFFDSQPDRVTVAILAHELLHALGLQGHTRAARFPDSVMTNAWFHMDGALPAIDAAAVQVLYTRLDEDTEPEELSPTSFGAWSQEILEVGGKISGVSFGVRHANGISAPWTAGVEPSSALADNPRLPGTVTWSGELVGFTPDLVTVSGDAAISVELGTMDGTAAFTELQSWSAGEAPCSRETWYTGELNYTITVGANYLRSTGDDAGTVNGSFYGRNHEGVAGSVERYDLTAAFGAVR